MDNLRTFFMEEFLENNRFHSKYNLGESGGRARTVRELLVHSGLNEKNIGELFLNLKLNDSPNRGRDDLREIVASFHPGATRDEVLITTGTSEALFLLFRYLKPKRIALAIPAFQLLYELPMALQANIIPLPIRYSKNGSPFIDEQEWILILENEKPDCLLINNPHNPSGLILSENFIQQLSLTAKKLGASVIGDEHYRFLSSKTEPLGHSVYKCDGKTFVTGSFIKCLGVPGMRIGWCVGPKQALDSMQNEKNYTTHTVTPIIEWIAFEVLKNIKTPLFAIMKREWHENINSLHSFLQQSKHIYGIAPEGGLVTSLGFKKATSPEQVNMLISLLLKKGVFVLPLSSMELGAFAFQNENSYKSIDLCDINRGLGFRLGLGCEPVLFKEALVSIESTLNEIDNGGEFKVQLPHTTRSISETCQTDKIITPPLHNDVNF